MFLRIGIISEATSCSLFNDYGAMQGNISVKRSQWDELIFLKNDSYSFEEASVGKTICVTGVFHGQDLQIFCQ